MARVVWTLGVWGLCGVAIALVLTRLTVGPTIYALDDTHGIHVGDVVACIALPAVAAWLTSAIWRHPRAARRR